MPQVGNKSCKHLHDRAPGYCNLDRVQICSLAHSQNMSGRYTGRGARQQNEAIAVQHQTLGESGKYMGAPRLTCNCNSFYTPQTTLAVETELHSKGPRYAIGGDRIPTAADLSSSACPHHPKPASGQDKALYGLRHPIIVVAGHRHRGSLQHLRGGVSNVFARHLAKVVWHAISRTRTLHERRMAALAGSELGCAASRPGRCRTPAMPAGSPTGFFFRGLRPEHAAHRGHRVGHGDAQAACGCHAREHGQVVAAVADRHHRRRGEALAQNGAAYVSITAAAALTGAALHVIHWRHGWSSTSGVPCWTAAATPLL